jgi:hypothetical protein
VDGWKINPLCFYIMGNKSEVIMLETLVGTLKSHVDRGSEHYSWREKWTYCNTEKYVFVILLWCGN